MAHQNGNALAAAVKGMTMDVPTDGAGGQTDRDAILSSVERPESFEVVFDRHAPVVYRYLRRRVGVALAEELTAETFIRAFGARRRFDHSGESALPWLFGIATNLVRMQRRTEERRLRAYGRAAERGLDPAATADADLRIDAIALRPVLASALADLPHAQREVLLLHAWAGLSPAEIAAALGVSAGTVRSRLHRARASVGERLSLIGNETSDEPMLETQ